ncbi:MAG: prolyl oligopeptidase family serine peptidase [Planctomycetaceae bacterium]|nr:prolyl oligopeptidase family serine peptidase [Planctomycetaceae bacterium]
MRSILFFTAVSFMFVPVMFAEDHPAAERGKQTVFSVELPASTSVLPPGQFLEPMSIPRPIDPSKKETVHYFVFLPADYDKQAEAGGAPLLLFLHGIGECGNDAGEVNRVKNTGLPNFLEKPEFSKKFSCIAVSPQCKKGYVWSPAQLMLLLDHVEKQFKVDKNRIYVSGLSMGGYGTWLCLNEAPNRFAAAVPICGGANPEWAKKLTNVPIWAFHGGNDNVVNKRFQTKMVEEIRAAGGTKIIFTLFDGVGHDAWTPAYANQLIYDWLFSQRLAK